METLNNIIAITLSAIIASYLGNILPLVLPRLSRHLNRKPFNCRPCTTFHLMWMLTTVSALILSSASLFTQGVISAFILFFIVKYIDNKKITK